MLDIVPGAAKKMPPVVTINLKTLLATSKLGEAGGFGPFPSQTILAYNGSKQGSGFVAANLNLTAQAAQTVPSTTAANNNPLSQSTAVPTTTGSPPDTTGSGTGRNRGNNSNIGNIENRGNSGKAPGRVG
jgi:hypothetical protein